jgi:ribosome-associated protein
LEQLSSLSGRKKSADLRLTRNSKIFKTIINAIQEKKGLNIVSLDLKKIHESVSDFFIVCEGSSAPQLKAIADNVKEKVEQLCDETPYKYEGAQTANWILVDYVNVVVHIMLPETRKFYKLEEMWSDGGMVEHKD